MGEVRKGWSWCWSWLVEVEKCGRLLEGKLWG